MNEDLHRHLDEDAPPDALNGDGGREAEAWDRLLHAFRTQLPPAAAPPWLEERVMAEIEALPEPGWLRSTVSWLLSPRPVRVSPLVGGLAAAAVAFLFLVRGPGPESYAPGSAGELPGPAAMQAGNDPALGPGAVVYVQFVLDAPDASSVVVTGEFDGWGGSHVLADPDGDGTWSGRVPLPPGVHAYMFLVDGSTWVTDPRAQRYAEDGFGNRNAVLAVAAPTT